MARQSTGCQCSDWTSDRCSHRHLVMPGPGSGVWSPLSRPQRSALRCGWPLSPTGHHRAGSPGERRAGPPVVARLRGRGLRPRRAAASPPRPRAPASGPRPRRPRRSPPGGRPATPASPGSGSPKTIGPAAIVTTLAAARGDRDDRDRGADLQRPRRDDEADEAQDGDRRGLGREEREQPAVDEVAGRGLDRHVAAAPQQAGGERQRGARAQRRRRPRSRRRPRR